MNDSPMKRNACRMSRGRSASARDLSCKSGHRLTANTLHATRPKATLIPNRSRTFIETSVSATDDGHQHAAQTTFAQVARDVAGHPREVRPENEREAGPGGRTRGLHSREPLPGG